MEKIKVDVIAGKRLIRMRGRRGTPIICIQPAMRLPDAEGDIDIDKNS